MPSIPIVSHFSSSDIQGGISSRKEVAGRSSWKPSALRSITLITATLISWALIATIQILLARSQTNGGIIVAAKAEDFTITQSFSYLYLPTIIALVFSIFWSWIDLQIKRVEPYYQLSRPDGAWGKDSLLISYPFDFLPFVPLSAFRSRHWAVFWGSICIVFVTWGLVPLQAGLFATETISRTSAATFVRSINFTSASEQPKLLTGRYIHSAHGIIWLNETLPPYMTRDYVLAPLKLQESTNVIASDQTWTADTTLYSLDMKCEVPTIKVENTTQITSINTGPQTVEVTQYTSSNGCGIPTDFSEALGNDTIGPNESFDNQSIYDTKEFSSVYMGYYSTDFSDYYLEGYCPETANHTFMALFTRNKAAKEDAAQNATRLFCTPFYYQQEVTAVIGADSRRPLNVTARGDKQGLPAEKWNSTFFEYQMNTGKNNEQPRDSLPLKYWPDQLETVSTMPVSLGNQGVILGGMAGFILGASNYSIEELLEPEALRAAYEATFRIIFARSMVEILDQNFTNIKTTNGSTTYSMAAVVVVPVFTYIVEGLLGAISLCSIALLIISFRRKWSLHSDPATIASVMALVSDNPALLEDFAKLDQACKDDFEQSLKDKKYQLEYNERGNIIGEADSFDPLDHSTHGVVRTDSDESRNPKPVRPREFRSFMVVPFVSLLVALAITLGVLLTKARPYGIARPSKNAIVRQILENYIPTALATLIEPVWVLINRLLCMLQPLEELRGGNATAHKSIDANYSSLPPQLVIFKALRSSHFKLAAACTMALLANVLAVAFSGMFNEASINVPSKLFLQPPYQAKFVTINGTVGPNMSGQERLTMKLSGAYTGGLGSNQFLVAESNYTAGTPMPAWTNDQFLFVPFANDTILQTQDIQITQARTTAIGSELKCAQINPRNWTASWFSDKRATSFSNVSVVIDGVSCERRNIETAVGPSGPALPSCQTGKVAMELVLLLQARQNASTAEQKHCSQSVVFGYVRDHDICTRNTTTAFHEKDAIFVGCRANLIAGQGNVGVDSNGRVKHVNELNVSSNPSPQFLSDHFSNNASNLLQQGNTYILQFPGARWHNQSFASEFMNYFITKQSNSSRLVDPNVPLPSFEDLTRTLYPVYSKLFAIWLGINKDKLLLHRDEDSTFTIEGLANKHQIRIFLSMPLFIIAEAILSIYTIVAVCIYMWRPGRFLPRMPTSIGAIIALFAASEAVGDMRGTSLFNKKERRKHLNGLGETYGYGTFVGADGKLHEGIEKEPLVNAVPLPGVLSKVQTGFSQTSLVFKRSRA
ncbi:hypothetical protein T440DRAFT_47365 [Plenodomus tracheiphilus IPT5]|uniref:Uncharacterized protein n=1 Tax=Plenodomus tracheiphilus IPT5 TaxID=1408161 RepID=A0A6A7B9N1_9PLEO|nr:hypothetical protein T440DRAFT_47365 [Plenodomus tracheiphilus IPT5]